MLSQSPAMNSATETANTRAVHLVLRRYFLGAEIPLQPPSEYSLRSYHIAFQYCRRIRGSFASRENRSADFSRRNRMIDDRFKTGTFLLNLETA